jgi:putative sterol carrier protein
MTTPGEFFEQLAQDTSKMAGLNHVFQFDVTGDTGGQWYVDASGDEPKIVQGTHDNPGCTLTMSDEDLLAILEGKLNSQMAFMMGKLKVSGDMSLALQLQKLFG